VRRLVQSTLTAVNRAIVARVANKLAAELEVQKHINGQLQAALFNEKDKRTRGKRLGLTGEEVTGEAYL
jgi:predicted porin